MVLILRSRQPRNCNRLHKISLIQISGPFSSWTLPRFDSLSFSSTSFLWLSTVRCKSPCSQAYESKSHYFKILQENVLLTSTNVYRLTFSLSMQCNISREAQTLTLVDHPNVLKAHCSFVNDHTLWIVMPYMAGGSCLHILKSAYPDGFEEAVIATLLREALKGLEYLHQHGHIHRDVKASCNRPYHIHLLWSETYSLSWRSCNRFYCNCHSDQRGAVEIQATVCHRFTGYGFTPNSSSPFLSCLDFFRFSLLVIPSEISCSSLRGFTMASGVLVLCSFADKILPLGWHHFQNHLVALYSRLFLNTLLKNQVLLFGTFA